jgi:(p)ppGpp synthase/HD superfamily hydrolase
LEATDQQRLARAVEFALAVHAGQQRKGSGAPYACHLLQVSGLVLEHGGSVDQAAAGLLHDAIEDCGVTPDELERHFGGEVARIVVACTDLRPGDSPNRKSPWLERKQGFLASLRDAHSGALLVVACDKLDNMRSLVADLEAEGPGVFERFNATPNQTLWYYREVSAVLRGSEHARAHAELERLCAQLARWVAQIPA